LASNEKGAEYPISNKEFPISKEGVELDLQDQTVFLLVFRSEGERSSIESDFTQKHEGMA